MEENQKISKIISEFNLFLLDLGKNKIEIDVQKQGKQTILLFSCEWISEDILKEMSMKLSKKRDSSFELYGWELIGQADSDEELGLIGSLVDEFSYQQTEERVHFKMVRYEI